MARTIHERADVLPALGEVFREHGFEGASLALIGERTGLGKGSLYHFFPGGKEEMAEAVLQEIDSWFAREVFAPLRTGKDARAAISAMLASVGAYFRSGRRVCLVGVFALGDVRDRFAARVDGYFGAWQEALTAALVRLGHKKKTATALSEESVAAIQGALVLARARHDPDIFRRTLARLGERLLTV